MSKTFLLPVLILVAFAVYGSTLSGGFLGDDYSLLGYLHQAEAGYAEEAQWGAVEDAFFKQVPEHQLPKYYRPFWVLSHYVEHEIFGIWSPGFRMDNLLLFAFSAFFLACFLEALTGSALLGLSAALLFLVLPTNYASVQWIADRTGQLAVCFQMLSLWLFLLFVQKRSWLHAGAAWLAAVGALLSKETSLILFPLLALLGWGLARSLAVGERKKIAWSALAFAGLLLAYFLWRHHILGTFLGGARDPGGYTLPGMVWNQLGVAFSLLVPVRWPEMGPGFFWSALVLALGLLGGGLYLVRRSVAWWPFFLLWFVASLLPNALDSSLPGVQRNLRFTFPAALPFVVLVILALQGWLRIRKPRFRSWFAPALGLLLASSAVLLVHNRRSYVEAGELAPKILDRVLGLAGTESTEGVLVFGLPAWHGNAPLLLNAGPYLAHPPFLARARRPFLVYPDGELGQLFLLREAPRFLRGGTWHALRWDALRQALIPAELPRYEELRGQLIRAKAGHLVLVPQGGTALNGLRIAFSRKPLAGAVDREVQIRGVSIETSGGRELLVAEIRPL